MSKFLTVLNDPKTGPTTMPELAMPIKYTLDPFQQHAIYAISQGHNVLVTAKTGSGKTLVGEYQIAHSLAQGKRVFYTTPIKSLSNQKLHDLKLLFGERNVGIMTGDIKDLPTAPIVVMTTEILKILLDKLDSSTKHLGVSAQLSLTGLDAVVFDEVHYFNDKDRGKVWEQTFIMLPPEIKLVMLSATVSGAEKFAAWIGDLKQRPITLITTLHRVVPLHHVVFGDDFKFITIMESTGVYNDAAYKTWIRSTFAKHKYVHTLNDTLAHLNKIALLPALVFTFSITMCERHAAAIEKSFTSGPEAAEISRTVDYYLHGETRTEFEKEEYFHVLLRLVKNGIAYHHGGLHPKLKEIIELLFSRGLIKVLFCTETFSVGINMPTKTVVFTDYVKPATGGFRILRPDEYMQMAGRAGRRGKDKQGIVIYLPTREPADPAEVRAMMTGSAAELVSQMRFNYEFILKALQSGSGISWETIMKNSYWYLQQNEALSAIEARCSALRITIATTTTTPEISTALDERERLEIAHRTTTGDAKKAAQKAVDKWRNSHVGPVWENAWKARIATAKQTAELGKLEAEMAATRVAFKQPIVSAVRFLVATGFLVAEAVTLPIETLTTSHLTEKGIMATEINDGNGLLVAELYCSGKLAAAAPAEIVATLAALACDRTDDESPSLAELHVPDVVLDGLKWLDSAARRLSDAEYRSIGPEAVAQWELSTTWVEPLYRWATGEEFSVICSEYGIRGGTFVRTVLKMASMMEEWVRLATLRSDVEMLEKLKDVQGLLVRGIVKPDSLYLRV